MSVHEFNPFTGRLKQSTGTRPLYPLSPRPLQSVEPPVMMYDSILTKPLKIESSGKGKYSTVSPKIAALQKKYQADLSKPVYLLGGLKDKILFRFTVAATMASFVVNMYYVYKGTQK